MDKILIVEDSMELSDVLCRNLQEEGFAVSIASSLAQARKSLDSGIDLCLLDLNLPDGDGFTFCRYLGENTAIPVILLTVRDEPQDMHKSGAGRTGDSKDANTAAFADNRKAARPVLKRSLPRKGQVYSNYRYPLVRNWNISFVEAPEANHK